jgi:UDP-N-acetylglucosamine acyltransferase
MIHPLAIVHPEAQLGNNVKVDAFAVIEKDVSIGDNTWIASHSMVHDGARIGNNVKIYPGAVVSAIPQDLKFRSEETVTIIGDNTTLREYVTISRGTADKFKTEIGKNCLIMAYVHVAHDCIIGNNVIISNAVQLAGHVRVDDFAVIGGTSAVHQFVRVGAHTMISGGSLVRKDVPPFTKAGREPLSYAGINSVGLNRRGFDSDTINVIQEIYRVIYMSGLNHTQACKIVEDRFSNSAERNLILDFIRSSERGIMKGYTFNGRN